ncbi:bifunctional [glutamine synthetase] adenylyltransferase/[glutamine synthetase]-adenylyl-L-tyrosine phosphorylase [Mycetocola reblochoni]|uniref:bifunctional [glutamine synthetase] adenylyltransferase/[glutamine synthetase]-adenylyl-L-tyrosine phosphorylase n=1 Tax=Mycetocola reblochoni TaxID=331618 RepID=UPI003F983944
MARDPGVLSALARSGFASLSASRLRLEELRDCGVDVTEWLADFRAAADPDQALVCLADLASRVPEHLEPVLGDEQWRTNLLTVLGASQGLGEFLLRHPDELAVLRRTPAVLPSAAAMTSALVDAVTLAIDSGDDADADRIALALRVAYRRQLARIAVHDLRAPEPTAVFEEVSAALSDLAGAALEGALLAARAIMGAHGPFSADQVAATRLAIIGMGKAGARELNYVSDVDVIYVAESADEELVSSGRAVEIGTRLAMTLMRVISETGVEPALWEVDPNLRPEGKQGALVRTLSSHLAYYERWAKGWEFQALIKARPLAGDGALGEDYVAGVAPSVWSSAGRENFVEQAQHMRERVTEHIPADQLHYEIKLGPGGLRDVEFTVQLLQLVHGQTDPSVRLRGTLETLDALARGSYIGREEATAFAAHYRFLRVIEHRLQLQRLRRTHLMPRDEDELRVLARSTRLAPTAQALVTRWESTKGEVRKLHLRLFYRPLLSAVAALREDEVRLTTPQAEGRLAAIGFRDPEGALNHIRALSSGVSRRATIQRTLLPVMLRWFAEGADPDYGLLAFRRLSDKLGGTHWYLRMLRDSSGAAERLTHALSTSRFIGELLDVVPESAAWLESNKQLEVRPAAALRSEAAALAFRHSALADAAKAVQRLRRREVLRMALASVSSVLDVREVARGLTEITEVTLSVLLERIRAELGAAEDVLEFAIIGMGRLGGAETGFGSDADVLYVYRAVDEEVDAGALARRIVTELQNSVQDPRLPFDLDADLRPEGKNGPLARSLEGYASYYRRWSLTWEAQALLRARGIAGDESLIADFESLADTVRYPEAIAEKDVREVKRIKARVESERMPQGADPRRQLKLGRGSLSDVEWFVQLVQLQHAHAVPELRTTSTLAALDAAAQHGLIAEDDAVLLREAWLLASRLRSANMLWLNRASDVLPSDRVALDGIARILDFPPRSASVLEEEYLAVTRRARQVFEAGFYGEPVSENRGGARRMYGG